MVLEETLTLNCDGGGFPEPKYSWYWKNRPISPSLMSYSLDGPILRVNHIRVDNTGTFSCLLVNPAGSAEKHFDVSVHGKLGFDMLFEPI